MDILKRSISNITDEAWSEIDERASSVLKSHMSARKFVDVAGPYGWEHAAQPLGRLELAISEDDDLTFGVHKVMPLAEVRVHFELDTWELDNISRGSMDPELGPLEDAARKIAQFEEKAVYKGLEQACITGLAEAAAENTVEGSKESLMDVISKAAMQLAKNAVEGPYALVADEGLWTYIYSRTAGYPLSKSVTSIADGGIILSPVVDGSYLVSLRGGDMELALGQDLSVGYQGRAKEKVSLFITESFSFRVIVPEAIIPLKLD